MNGEAVDLAHRWGIDTRLMVSSTTSESVMPYQAMVLTEPVPSRHTRSRVFVVIFPYILKPNSNSRALYHQRNALIAECYLLFVVTLLSNSV